MPGYIPLPKSSNPTRLIENLNLFEFTLSEEVMAQLDALDEKFTASVTAGKFGQLEPY